MHPARELAQLRRATRRARRSPSSRSSAAVGVVARPRLCSSRSCSAIADQPLLRAVVQVALEPPALRVTGGDDPLARGLQLGEPRLGLGRGGARSRARSPSPRRPPRRSSGSSSSDGVVDERGDQAPVALDRRDGARRGTRQLARRPSSASRRLGSPSARGERRLQVRGVDRRQPAEQVGEAAARQPRAQQPGQERERDASRASRPRSTAASASASPTTRSLISSARSTAARTRRPRSAAARAGAAASTPTSGATTTTHGHEAAEHEQTALDRVDRVRDVGVGEGEQQVALLGVGHHPGELTDHQRNRERRHEQAVEARLQPPAGQQRQDQRDERGRSSSRRTGPAPCPRARPEAGRAAAGRRTASPSRSSAHRCGCPAAGATRSGRTPRTSRRRSVKTTSIPSIGASRSNSTGLSASTSATATADPQRDPEPPLRPRRTETREGGRARTPRLDHAEP